MNEIILNETVDLKREIIFALVDRTNSDLRVAGHSFSAGQIKLRVPGVAIANVATGRINELGGGHYSIYLDDGEVTAAGSGFLEIDETLTAAIPNTIMFEIVDPSDYGGASSGGGGSSTLLPAGLVTLASIREIVRQRGDYLSSLTFTNAYINIEIQAAFNELYELMDSVNEGWWDTEAEVDCVASQAYRALPTNCWRVKLVEIEDGTEWSEIDQVSTSRRNRSSSTGKPYAYRLTSRGLDLTPVPNSDYTLRITYTPICPALDEEDGIELYGWQEFVIEGALLRLDKRSEKPIDERWKTLYAPEVGLKARITAGANKRKQAGPEYLNLCVDGASGSYEDPY